MANGTDLQEAYKKAILENMPNQKKGIDWESMITSSIPSLTKIIAATTMNPEEAAAVSQMSDVDAQRLQAQREAYKQAQAQKQKDFLQILRDQMSQEESAKRYEEEKAFKEGQAKTQAEQFAQELELKKAKQAEDLATKQRELALKQMEIDAKVKSGENLTPEQKKYLTDVGANKAEAEKEYNKAVANYEPTKKQIQRALEILPKTYTGLTKGIEQTGARALSGVQKLFGMSPKDEKLANTAELNSIIGGQVISLLKSTFGAQLSDSERQYLVDLFSAGSTATQEEKRKALENILTRLDTDLETKKQNAKSYGIKIEEPEITGQKATEQKTKNVFEGTTKSGAKIKVIKE